MPSLRRPIDFSPNKVVPVGLKVKYVSRSKEVSMAAFSVNAIIRRGATGASWTVQLSRIGPVIPQLISHMASTGEPRPGEKFHVDAWNRFISRAEISASPDRSDPATELDRLFIAPVYALANVSDTRPKAACHSVDVDLSIGWMSVRPAKPKVFFEKKKREESCVPLALLFHSLLVGF